MSGSAAASSFTPASHLLHDGNQVSNTTSTTSPHHGAEQMLLVLQLLGLLLLPTAWICSRNQESMPATGCWLFVPNLT
jgi:hypothetical protein